MNTTSVVISGVVVFGEAVERESLQRALDRLCEMDALQYCVGKWLVWKRARENSVSAVLEEKRAELSHELLQNLLEKEVNTSFGENECPMRGTLLQDENRSALLLSFDHALFDGLSVTELVRRLLLLSKNPHLSFPDRAGELRSSCDYLLVPRTFYPLVVQAAMGLAELFRQTKFFTVRCRTSAVTGARDALSDSKPNLKYSRSNSALVFASLNKVRNLLLFLL